MTTPERPLARAGHAPRRILLATDLSFRSDRALDRALQLARAWGARLVALTVVDGPRAAPAEAGIRAGGGEAGVDHALRVAERRLHADAGGAAGDVALHVRVERGDVAERILDVARQEDCGLIVLGIARHEAFSRAVLGSTVDTLAGRSPVPLLVVRQRVRAPYGGLVVASDFSAAAGHALRHASELFPELPLWLFHAYRAPYPLRADIGHEQAHEDGFRLARHEAEAHVLATGLPAPLRERLHYLLEHGDPGLLLEARGQTHPDDLVVLGAKRRGRLLNLLLGDRAQHILERAENDVLVIGQPRDEG